MRTFAPGSVGTLTPSVVDLMLRTQEIGCGFKSLQDDCRLSTVDYIH